MKNTFTAHSNKILSLVLAIAMIFSMLPVTAFAEAEPDDGTYATSGVTVSGRDEDETPEPPASYSIVAFAALADSVAMQTVTVDATRADLTLPESLDATVSEVEAESEESIGGVTWQSEPEFEAVTVGALEIIPAGTYVFTPSLPEGYALADGVALPVITVEVKPMGIKPAAGSVEGIFKGKYGKDQIFDCFRDPATPVAGTRLILSYFGLPFDDSRSTNPSSSSTRTQFTDAELANCYFAFEDVGNGGYNESGYPVRLSLYRNNGILDHVVSDTGQIYALGSAGFVYISKKGFGYFISNGTGYSKGGGVAYTPTTGLVKNLEDLINYNASSEVVAAGNYLIMYDENYAGAGKPDTQTAQKNVSVNLQSAPTRDGYTFLGWATSSSATSAEHQAGASYTGNISVTFYAVWEMKNTDYGISLDFNIPKIIGADYYLLGDVKEGYTAEDVETLIVTITNTGKQPTGKLTIENMYGSPDFTLSSTSIESIDVGETDSFTVMPNLGLPLIGVESAYMIFIKVSGSNVEADVFRACIRIRNGKTKPTTPPAPPAAGITVTDDKVTLVADPDMQFSKDGTTWQDSNVFENLDPNTEYTFYQRKKATDTEAASDTSPGLTVKTKKAAIKGKPTITTGGGGDINIGTELSVDTTGLNDTSNLTYQWYRDGVEIGGATGDTYTVTGADAGKTITVTVTADAGSGYEGSVTSDTTSKVNYTIILPTYSDNGDSVTGGTVYSSNTIDIVYTIAKTKIENKLVLKVGETVIKTLTDSDTSPYTYTVNAAHADADGKITITATFSHSDFLTTVGGGTVPAPEKGETPKTSIDEPYYKGEITWDGELTDDGKFKDDTAYTAEVELTAKGDAYFYDYFMPDANGGIVSDVNVSDDGKTVTYTITYPKTPAQSGGADVEGDVTDNTNPAAIIVTLENGNTVIASVEATAKSGVAETYTFSFTNIPDGIYNLVVNNGSWKVTQAVTIVNGKIINPADGIIEIDMASGRTQSVIEIVNADTPPTSVGGLPELFNDSTIYTAADAALVSGGGTVEIKLAVEKIDSPADANLIADAASGQTIGLYLDLSVIKSQIDSTGALLNETKLADLNGNLITITFELPDDLKGKGNLTIYRVHGNGVDKLTSTPNAAGENAVISGDFVTLTVCKFSIYAIAYTQTSSPNPPVPPTSPSSNGGSLSGGDGGGGGTGSASSPTQLIDESDAKTLAKLAAEQGADSVRTSSSGESGIRKKALQTLGKSGLTYRHDTVADRNATAGGYVQVRVYVDDPNAATKDIFVSGYTSGTNVDKTTAIINKWFGNNAAVISFDQQGDFGMNVRIAALANLSDLDTSNLYFYSYDKVTNKYKLIVTEYSIDSKGYVHFSTVLGGSIIITDRPLSKTDTDANAEAEAEAYEPPITGGSSDNPTTGGDGAGMYIPPAKAQPQDFAVANSIVEAVAADGVLRLESNSVPAAIAGNAAGNVNNGGILKVNLDAPNILDAAQESGKPSVGLIVGITIALLFAAMILWVVIPRKDDEITETTNKR